MRKGVHYGLLSTAAFCFLAGVVVILVGYLRYLNAYDTYKLDICQVVNRTLVSEAASIQLEVFGLPVTAFRKWFMVASLDDYGMFVKVPCYVSAFIMNGTTVVNNIEIDAYSDILSLIIGLGFLGACLVLLLTFIVIGVVDRRRRRYNDVAEIPSDFRYQDSPIYHRELPDEDSLELVLQSFEEAQRLLWKNKYRVREHIFDRLRQEQIVAMLGEHSTRISFQKNVHAALSRLESQ